MSTPKAPLLSVPLLLEGEVSFVNQVVDHPEVFFAADDNVTNQTRSAAKQLYDLARQSDGISTPFPTLFIEGFDNEQIWEELALVNTPFLELATEKLKKLKEFRPSKLENMASEYSDEETALDAPLDEEMESINDMDEDMEHSFEDFEDEEEIDEEFEDEESNDDDQVGEEEESGEEYDDDGEDEETESQRKTSELDDDFFNLDEFNKYSLQLEEEEMRRQEKEENEELNDEDESEEEEEEEIDMTQDPDDLDIDSEEDEKPVEELMYDDFFAPPRRKAKSKGNQKRSVHFEGVSEEEEEEHVDDDESDKINSSKQPRDLFADEEDDLDNSAGKSEFEKRQERLKKQIEALEQENIAEKDWTLKGEATAKARPLNSLLEEDLEYDHVSKPVPVVTQEMTESLEDMIKKRILDGAFDDVERKRDPTFRPFLPSKQIELSDEKSKKSLAEIYEDEYVQQTTGNFTNEKDEKLRKAHEEINLLFGELCQKLDSLSNFHYTPKPAKPEFTVVADVPTIEMEEVIPTNASNATLLAPEEVYEKPKGEVKSVEEMDQAERARLRAKKKRAKQRERKLKEREQKVIQKINPGLGNKHTRQKALESLASQRNVTIIDKEGAKKPASELKNRGKLSTNASKEPSSSSKLKL
ncbi:uncharacterized protein VTP21DRAFT_9909 [Calcarisporiella thermophila]|uniref:uncharacterized protein n=1 Tax=Calcarisporiella thermophila TaxID=911321 RepID=UPI0037439080